MSGLSTAQSTPGDNVALLLREVYAARRETRKWRQRAEWLERSRDHWREEAKVWKWGALHGAKR